METKVEGLFSEIQEDCRPISAKLAYELFCYFALIFDPGSVLAILCGSWSEAAPGPCDYEVHELY